MRSSMSSSSSPGSDTRKKISVVIGSSAPAESLEACLAALEPQLADDVEVLVEEALASPSALRERFPWARYSERPAALVPELWRDGIDAASGQIVALTIAPMVPAPDWIARLRALHGEYDAVAGAIDPGERLRPSEWAEYFCRYARELRPFQGHDTVDLPGDNASYKRELLETVRDSYRDGFWEPVVHRRLQANGVRLRQEPSLVVFMGRSAGARAFTAQRLAHGRRYGHQRGLHFSTARNLAGALGSPLVPFLMSWRVLSRVLQRRRYRLRALAVLPLIFWFNLVWASAEARGHLDMLRR
jgi:hypothetical protein